MKRSEIETKYKWDLSKFCTSDEEFFKKLEKLKSEAKKILQYKEKLGDANKLLEFFVLQNKISEIAEPLLIYVYCSKDIDLSNTKYIEMSNILDDVLTKISSGFAFASPELLRQTNDYLKALLSDARFKNNRFAIKDLIRKKTHFLSDKEEEIISKTSAFASEFSDVYKSLSDVDFKFDDAIDAKGNKFSLNQSNYISLLESSDRMLRKDAFLKYYKIHKQYKNTITANFIASVKKDWFFADVKKYKSVLEAKLFGTNLSEKLYHNLIKNVNESLPLLQKYYAILAKMLNLKDQTYYDVYLPAVSEIAQKFTYEEIFEIAKNALKPLGDEYLTLLDKSNKERWVDVYPTENKRSGAYCNNIYGVSPVVMLNFENSLDDLFTYVHEMGHAMHSFYSNSQPRELADYTIFLAEIASTVNEVLLFKYLYNSAKTKKEKIYYLDKYLKMFKGTFFRQTMFSEFEEFAHGLVERGEGISCEKLCEFYGNLNKKYHGDAIVHHENINYEWMRIPHFYRPFYVFQYATGLTSAVSIASKILNNSDYVKTYINFLKSGGCDYSHNILKKAGINLETDEPYLAIKKELNWALSELERLIK